MRSHWSPHFACLLVLAALSCNEAKDANTSSADSSPAAAPADWDVGGQPTAVLLAGYSVFVAHLGPEGNEPGRPDAWIGSYGPNGQLVDTLVGGLSTPAALAAVRDVLYVVEGNQLHGYRIADGQPSSRIEVSSRSLDAVAPAPEGTLFAASADEGQVWRIDPGAPAVVPIATLPDVTGLAFDRESSRLYFCTRATPTTGGRLYVLAPEEPEPLPMTDLRGDFRSLTLAGGRLFVSIAKGPNARGGVLALSMGETPADTAAVVTGIELPGQVALLGEDLLFTPVTAEGRVAITRLPSSPSAAQ